MMLVKRLLDHFDSYTRLHIDVNDVRDQLVDMGVQDEIRFHFVKMDKDKIRGILYRYSKQAVPYGSPIHCSEIVISNDMGDEAEYWARLVAVKELLHITDCTRLVAGNEVSINGLFESFSQPPEIRISGDHEPSTAGSARNDRVRIYLALAVLIPAGCRQPLRELYRTGKLSDREIADIARVPSRYIPVVMTEAFEHQVRTFLDWEENEYNKSQETGPEPKGVTAT